ncbi:transcription elongation protein SprT [Roseivirga sp.]|uniref:transcription elongation protein SprT n=1 Tax=Roseivirga sp. TaxID=1964215 RepID=UPI003B8BF458
MIAVEEALKEKVPQEALSYCVQLWVDDPFQFKLSRARTSKLGDYRFDPKTSNHTVTVNRDLNPYQFLITYVHEVAHRKVHRLNALQKPHGQEWKQRFQQLMLPLLRPEVFPDDILRALARHMKNPKASTAADPKLLQIVSGYDENKDQGPTLASLAVGDEFVFRKRSFRKIETKRTRALCLDLGNKRNYLIPMLVEVEPLN